MENNLTMLTHIRYLTRSDVDEVIKFDWNEAELRKMIRTKNCIPMVAEQNNEIIGYCVCELKKSKFLILRIGQKKSGAIKALLEKFKGKLTEHRRTEIEFFCSLENLPLLKVFKENGFKAEGFQEDYYDDDDKGTVKMVFSILNPIEIS